MGAEWIGYSDQSMGQQLALMQLDVSREAGHWEIGELMERVKALSQTKNFVADLRTDPKLMAEWINYALILMEIATKRTRVRNKSLLDFMQTVDKIFRIGESDEQMEDTRAKAVKVLIERYDKTNTKVASNILSVSSLKTIPSTLIMAGSAWMAYNTFWYVTDQATDMLNTAQRANNLPMMVATVGLEAAAIFSTLTMISVGIAVSWKVNEKLNP